MKLIRILATVAITHISQHLLSNPKHSLTRKRSAVLHSNYQAMFQWTDWNFTIGTHIKTENLPTHRKAKKKIRLLILITHGWFSHNPQTTFPGTSVFVSHQAIDRWILSCKIWRINVQFELLLSDNKSEEFRDITYWKREKHSHVTWKIFTVSNVAFTTRYSISYNVVSPNMELTT